MQLNRTDLADFNYFLVIARHRSFRRAGLELRVSASALSHSLKGLEARLGVHLLNRTSRSVTLTAAGEELRAAIAAHFEAIGSAVDVLNRYRDDPAGRIRLNVLEHAATMLLAPALPRFIELYTTAFLAEGKTFNAFAEMRHWRYAASPASRRTV